MREGGGSTNELYDRKKEGEGENTNENFAFGFQQVFHWLL
jgi:hypothetical protein